MENRHDKTKEEMTGSGDEAPQWKVIIIVCVVAVVLIAFSWLSWFKFHWFH